jgi:hypothetical protein
MQDRQLSTQDQRIEDELVRIYSHPSCKWCRHPDQRINKDGYCALCDKTRKSIIKLKDQYEREIQSVAMPDFRLTCELKLQIGMAQLAMQEGARFGGLHIKRVDGLRLENILNHVSDEFQNTALFKSCANSLEWSFSPSVRKMICHLMSVLMRDHDMRCRRYHVETSHLKTSDSIIEAAENALGS